MREVVLLQKVSKRSSFREFREAIASLVAGLKVKLMEFDVVDNGWVKVGLSGEDENVAVKLLEKKVGLTPDVAENVDHFNVMRGRVVFSVRPRIEVFVDVGVYSPKPVYAVIPLRCLQRQLVDGKKFALSRILELFGLSDGVPVEVRILKITEKDFQAELTERQLEQFERWISSSVDRLIVLGIGMIGAEKAIRKAKIERDILGIESLGLMDCVVVCKLGTDVFGLVPKLGRLLGRASLVCFCPQRILSFVEGRW